MQGRCDLGEELITFLGSEIAQGATDETNHPAGQLLGLVVPAPVHRFPPA